MMADQDSKPVSVYVLQGFKALIIGAAIFTLLLFLASIFFSHRIS